MNSRALTMALLIAAAATFFIYSWIEEVETKAQKRFGDSVLVLKAKRDIKEAETINESLLVLEAIPKTFLEPNSIFFEKAEQDEETLVSVRSLNGTVAIVPIKKGEQIAMNKITEPGVRTGLSPQISPGKRAIAVNVTEITGIAKLIKPGDRVDVIAVFDAGGGKENKISKTVLQDVVVLSTGKNITNNIARVIERDGAKEKIRSLSEDVNYQTIALEVEPNQAQQIGLLIFGDVQLYFSLRNNDDSDRATGATSTTLRDVFGADLSRVIRAPAATQQGGMR